MERDDFGEALPLLRGKPERRAERPPQQGPQRVLPEAGEIREPGLVGHRDDAGPRSRRALTARFIAWTKASRDRMSGGSRALRSILCPPPEPSHRMLGD